MHNNHYYNRGWLNFKTTKQIWKRKKKCVFSRCNLISCAKPLSIDAKERSGMKITRNEMGNWDFSRIYTYSKRLRTGPRVPQRLWVCPKCVLLLEHTRYLCVEHAMVRESERKGREADERERLRREKRGRETLRMNCPCVGFVCQKLC